MLLLRAHSRKRELSCCFLKAEARSGLARAVESFECFDHDRMEEVLEAVYFA